MNQQTKPKENTMDRPRVVSRDEWLVARKQYLIKKKEFTRLPTRTGATS